MIPPSRIFRHLKTRYKSTHRSSPPPQGAIGQYIIPILTSRSTSSSRTRWSTPSVTLSIIRCSSCASSRASWLVKARRIGRHVDDFALGFPQLFDCCKDRLRFHHHSCSATVGSSSVFLCLSLVQSRSWCVRMSIKPFFGRGPAYWIKTLRHFWEEGYNIKLEV